MGNSDTIGRLIFLALFGLWSTIEAAPESCYHYLYAYSGDIQSPNFPQHYPSGRNCTWVITTLPTYHVRLTFRVFDLESQQSCNYDSVSIYDGPAHHHNLLGKFCGNRIPPSIFSTGNTLTIIFVSDATIQAQGFNASFASTQCGANFRQESGVIEPIRIPDGYPCRNECVWTIQVPHGRHAVLDLAPIEISDSSTCGTDYLEVREGLVENQGQVLAKFCNGEGGLSGRTNYQLVSASGELFIRWIFVGSTQGIHFGATFFSEHDECAANNHSCSQICHNTMGSYTCSCNAGYTLSSDGRTCLDVNECEDGSSRCQQLCENTVGSYRCACRAGYVLGPDNRSCLDVDECRDPNNGCQQNCTNLPGGYECACYDDYHLSSNNTCVRNRCGDTLRATNSAQRLFSHPSFGTSPYSNGANCNWTIRAEDRSKNLYLNFEILDLEFNQACAFDSVTVSDTRNFTRALCGQRNGTAFHFNSTTATVLFKTDGSVTAGGFKLAYRQQ